MEGNIIVAAKRRKKQQVVKMIEIMCRIKVVNVVILNWYKGLL